MTASVFHTKVLLTQIIQHLKLEGENVVVSTAASTKIIHEMWSILKLVDPTLTSSGRLRKSSLDSKPQLKKFMDHCCVTRKYMFQIKKCGSLTCSICKPPHLPQEIFEQIKLLPDPMPGENYKPFSEVYGTTTSKEHCPSSTKKTKRRKTLPFPSKLKQGEDEEEEVR